ncbi:hypothetical protein L0P92_35070, partial [Streptomyces muensis]|nr:hypothetical protein [Streptomyces muensis]
MRRYGPAVLLLLTGAAILRISLFSELYLRYVQATLRPYLVVSGCVLVGLGVLAAVVGRGPGPGRERERERPEDAGHEQDGEHGHDGEREHDEGHGHDEEHDHSHSHSHSPR